MVLLTMTPAMVAAIRRSQQCVSPIPTCEDDGRSSEPSLQGPAVGKPISHGQVLDLAKSVPSRVDSSSQDTRPCHLDVLLRGSHVYIPPAKPRPETTAEYKALMQKLRREEESREYQRLIHPTNVADKLPGRFQAHKSSLPANSYSAPIDVDDDDITYADINRQLTLVLNVLISIIACSIAIWLAASSWTVPKRLGLSMAGSGIVATAEVAVYAGYLRRLKEAKERVKLKKERKEIVRTWVVGGGGQTKCDTNDKSER